SPRAHLHDMDGDVIHHHARNVTMSEFFRSLGMDLTDSCFGLDNGSSFCDNGNESLRMFVLHRDGEREQVDRPASFVCGDLDKLLITYGPRGSDVSAQEASVTDKACIQSGKCPERGKPTDTYTCAGDVCQVS